MLLKEELEIETQFNQAVSSISFDLSDRANVLSAMAVSITEAVWAMNPYLDSVFYARSFADADLDAEFTAERQAYHAECRDIFIRSRGLNREYEALVAVFLGVDMGYGLPCDVSNRLDAYALHIVHTILDSHLPANLNTLSHPSYRAHSMLDALEEIENTFTDPDLFLEIGDCRIPISELIGAGTSYPAYVGSVVEVMASMREDIVRLGPQAAWALAVDGASSQCLWSQHPEQAWWQWVVSPAWIQAAEVAPTMSATADGMLLDLTGDGAFREKLTNTPWRINANESLWVRTSDFMDDIGEGPVSHMWHVPSGIIHLGSCA